jgi:hypothetical protein
MAQEQLALEREKLDREDYNKEADRSVKIQVAQIQAFSRQENLDTDGNGIPDPVEIGKQALEERKQSFEEYTKSQELQQNQILKEKELEIKRKDVETKQKEVDKKFNLEKEKLKVTRENMKNDIQVAKINAKNRNKK